MRDRGNEVKNYEHSTPLHKNFQIPIHRLASMMKQERGVWSRKTDLGMGTMKQQGASMHVIAAWWKERGGCMEEPAWTR